MVGSRARQSVEEGSGPGFDPVMIRLHSSVDCTVLDTVPRLRSATITSVLSVGKFQLRFIFVLISSTVVCVPELCSRCQLLSLKYIAGLGYGYRLGLGFQTRWLHCTMQNLDSYILFLNPVADPGFSWGAPTPKVCLPIILKFFGRKLHESSGGPRIWNPS